MAETIQLTGGLRRNPTRSVQVGDVTIGGGNRIVVQSMAATRTQDIEATIRQVKLLEAAGADLVRVAVDSRKDVEALAAVRDQTSAPLSVDLQENYRLCTQVGPYVDKIRYNPGHLHHHEKSKSVRDKVAFIAETAAQHDCAIRVGVNCGSIDPRMLDRFPDDHVSAIVASATEHCSLLDDLGFDRFVVSLKDSDWKQVVEVNEKFASERPDVPLHLGVTEAGMPPEGVIKTRVAFEQLVSQGIGDTVRVSLTVPFDDKGMNIISGPSCSRVENEKVVDLAQDVKQMTEYASEYDVTIAVMGCRVNGPARRTMPISASGAVRWPSTSSGARSPWVTIPTTKSSRA